MNVRDMEKRKDTSGKELLYIKLIQDVCSYYEVSGRHTLPWRKNITPYKILVSEIMLQQTQVSRVLPKYTYWMKKYPTRKALAYANLQEILTIWQGLGYQRRAKALLTIAKNVSHISKSFNDLLALPGVGRYTASAVCAFAYNTFGHPLLETNIRTVLIEYLYTHKEYVNDEELYTDLINIELHKDVQAAGAREWYYALMDFGAYLKTKDVSHNIKSAHHVRQSPYKGSFRELRAKVLFAITHNDPLPQDERVEKVLVDLSREKYIVCKQSKYQLADV